MNLHYLPVGLNFKGKKVLVVGGGEVAFRKVEKLLSAGAQILVLSPELCSGLKELACSRKIEYQNLRFSPEVVEHPDFIVAATSSRMVNQEISIFAHTKKIPVCVVDDPSSSDFVFLATLFFKDFMIAISTDGNHPRISSRIRDFIRDHELELITEIISGKRHQEKREEGGKVYIVGAGPGAPELLTIRALALIKSADVIIKDYLVPEEIIKFSATRAKIMSLTQSEKRSGHGSRFRQQSLNQWMVQLAKEGKRVIRLKNGDPFLFGRGGEEVEYLISQGIPIEVIPGITSAIGASASIFLPLTHRGYSSAVTLITGRESEDKRKDYIDWQRLPKNGTIVIYMPIKNVEGLQRRLIEAGFQGETPAAVVEKATHPFQQRVFHTTLSNLSQTVKVNGIHSPAIIFVGETVKISAMTLQCLMDSKLEKGMQIS